MTQENKPKNSRLELKYCECCGGLWLRIVGGGQIYCAMCARTVAELPPATKRRKGSKRKQRTASPSRGTEVNSFIRLENGGAA